MPAAVNGKIYVIGGQTTESSEPAKAGFVNTVYEYDPASGKWTARAPMPTMRGGGVAAVVDGRIYVAGGRPPGGHDFAVYDPTADKWTTLANLPTQRNHLAAGAHDGKVYVFGGRLKADFAVRLRMR
jgi:N-acetylneuraminic acid mutarotase